MSSVETVDDAVERPACGVAKQCRDRDFRRVARHVLGDFATPCRNDECFPDRDPDALEDVVYAHGRASSSFHAPREP